MKDWRTQEHVGLKVEVDGHTAVVTLNNPPAHTWTVHSLSALRDLVGALNADRDIYALVITGDGEKFFSAGADLNQFASGDKAAAREAARRFGEAFEALSGSVACRSPRSTATPWAVAWNAHWPATCASLKTTPRSRCRRPPSACCRVPVAPRTCRAWSARAGPSA